MNELIPSVGIKLLCSQKEKLIEFFICLFVHYEPKSLVFLSSSRLCQSEEDGAAAGRRAGWSQLTADC